MKTVSVVSVFLFCIACGSSKPATQSPSNASAATSTPAATPSKPEPSTGGDQCYKDCLLNGPDSSPMTKNEWPTKSDDDKANDCSAACADANMPAEK